MGDVLLNLICTNRKQPFSICLKNAAELGRHIVRLNDFFHASKMPLISVIISIYSEHRTKQVSRTFLHIQGKIILDFPNNISLDFVQCSTEVGV